MKKRGHSRNRNRQFRKKPEIKMDEWILDNPKIKNVQVIAENGDNLGTMPAKKSVYMKKVMNKILKDIVTHLKTQNINIKNLILSYNINI